MKTYVGSVCLLLVFYSANYVWTYGHGQVTAADAARTSQLIGRINF